MDDSNTHDQSHHKANKRPLLNHLFNKLKLKEMLTLLLFTPTTVFKYKIQQYHTLAHKNILTKSIYYTAQSQEEKNLFLWTDTAAH